eukprot:196603-Amorphochlora_amoeboformis.AAC.1
MVSKPSTGSTLYASVMENSMAILSVVFLIGIAASKTILTKAAFKQVALQQALRATLPVCVVLFERAILGKTHNLWIYVSLLPLMVGPMLCVKVDK